MRIILEVDDDQVASLVTRLLDEKAPHLNPLIIPEGEGFLNVPQAAKYVNYSESQVYRLVQKKAIPFHKKGKKVSFLKEELHQWMISRG